MVTLMLAVLFGGALLMFATVLARGGRGVAPSPRALAMAALGGRRLAQVVTYTEDCSRLATMLLAYRDEAEPPFVREVVRDAVLQIDAVARAARLRDALSRTRRKHAFPTWPSLLLWAAGILDADAVATLVAWRGQAGIADLEGMTAEAIEHFRATLGGDEAPLITLFAEELLRLGVITPADLERGGPRAGAGSDDGA